MAREFLDEITDILGAVGGEKDALAPVGVTTAVGITGFFEVAEDVGDVFACKLGAPGRSGGGRCKKSWRS